MPWPLLTQTKTNLQKSLFQSYVLIVHEIQSNGGEMRGTLKNDRLNVGLFIQV